MPDYVPIPGVPFTGVPVWQQQLLDALAKNVSMLTGQYGSGKSLAVTSDVVAGVSLPRPEVTEVSARGAVVSASGVPVPDANDYVQLVRDLQAVVRELSVHRQVLADLLDKMKGQ